MRREFPAKVRVAAFERAGGRCERCCVVVRAGNGPEYHHRVAAAVGGEPTLDNCEVLCRNCHGAQTATGDIPAIAKTKRIRNRHINAADKRGKFRKPPPGYNAWTRRIEG